MDVIKSVFNIEGSKLFLFSKVASLILILAITIISGLQTAPFHLNIAILSISILFLTTVYWGIVYYSQFYDEDII